MMRLEVSSGSGRILAEASGEGEIFLVHRKAYEPGDRLIFSTTREAHVWLALDDAVAPALVFMRPGRHEVPVPFGDRKKTYSPKSFTGELHRLWLRPARPEELAARRDLALNPWDDPGAAALFPHASANVETRGEAVFAARNAIDGECANDDHGFWPYTSWGINRDPEAALTLDFGRPVLLDGAALTLRADFPHDAWWRRATLGFSDGSEEILDLRKTGAAQEFGFSPRVVSGAKLHRLVKAEDPSPFPALTRLQLFGVEVV